MLDDIVISKLREIQSKGLDKNTERVNKVDDKINILVKKIGETDSELADDLDSIIGEIYGSVAEMYFIIGFKEGMKKNS